VDDDLDVNGGFFGRDLGVLKHGHSAGALVEHVCSDVEGVHSTLGRGV
jgi:hypothetical protein